MKEKTTQHIKFRCNMFVSIWFKQIPVVLRIDALINGNNKKTNRYIHEKNRVKCEGFSPWVDS